MSKSDATLGELSLADLGKRVTKAGEHVDTIREVLTGLVSLTDDQRRTSDGRTRTGEGEALAAVLKVADAVPGAFTVLADKDGGKDRKTFETNFLREGLKRAELLDEIASDLEDLARDVRDTQLVLNGKARSVVLAAYEIAKPLAKHDEVVRSKLSPATNFFSAPARLAAKTRAAKKKVPT